MLHLIWAQESMHIISQILTMLRVNFPVVFHSCLAVIGAVFVADKNSIVIFLDSRDHLQKFSN